MAKKPITVSFRSFLNSTPLDVNRWSNYDAVDCAVGEILSPIGGGTVKQNTAVKMLLLNLYAAWLADPEMFIVYQRASKAYPAKSRYNSLGIGFTAIRSAADHLESYGYIEDHVGFFDKSRHKGFRTRIRSTEKLRRILDTCNVAPYMLDHHEGDELIILKDNNKELIEYKETAETYVMRLFLEGINQSLAQTRIALNVTDTEMEALKKRLRRHTNKSPIDFTRKRLRRIFNNSSFKQGGRFYHGWWQEILSDYRKFITINEKRTVEIDYSALILRMLYALEDLPAPKTGDPYTIASLSRDLAKGIFIIMLNADDEKSAYKAVRRDYPKAITKPIWDKAVNEIRKKHAPIAKHFFSGIGLDLQAADSNMAEIILAIINEQEIVALPIHDSFIVRSSYRDELEKAMELAASIVLNNPEMEFKTTFNVQEGDGKDARDLQAIVGESRGFFKQIENQRCHRKLPRLVDR